VKLWIETVVIVLVMGLLALAALAFMVGTLWQ